MPQGSFLGPLAFLILIDDLSTGCPLHKYVDDTTLSELVQPKQRDTHIQTYMYLTNLLTWADHNGMEINTSKTKEMVLGRLASTNLPHKPLKGLLHINCLVYILTRPFPGPSILTILSKRQQPGYIS